VRAGGEATDALREEIEKRSAPRGPAPLEAKISVATTFSRSEITLVALRVDEPSRSRCRRPAPAESSAVYAHLRPRATLFGVNRTESSPERQARAEQRRRTWRGGVAKLEDMEALDDAFWAAMSPERRVVAVWELSRESYGSEATTGLRGSPHGVRRL
jgi:hypothetical protein